MRSRFFPLAAVPVFLLCWAISTGAGELAPISLPAPQTEGGKPLMQALKGRESRRVFSQEKLPAQVLSNLLWAAFGINRPESGGRTAPSARNWQEIDIYVVTAEGAFLYDAKKNVLLPVLGEDIRHLTGSQLFVRDAAVNLVYVADESKVRPTGSGSHIEELYSASDVGFISQNVYLFCASEGLATVVRATIDRGPLAKAMKLRVDQKIVLAQSVGYPLKK